MTTEQALFKYLLRLADNNLILGHRLSEMCGNGPILEEDVAASNIALDLLGSSNAFYQYAAKIEGKGRTEDDLAFLRNERQFYNTLIVELPNRDFGFVMVRQLLVDAFDLNLYQALVSSKDAIIAGVAAKAIKEITYHLRHSAKWVERLGYGTEESHAKVQTALNELWRYTEELFDMNEVDEVLIKQGIAVDLKFLKPQWEKIIEQVLESATLKKPENSWQQHGSRDAKHTEHLGFLLPEMQYMQRTYPGVQW